MYDISLCFMSLFFPRFSQFQRGAVGSLMWKKVLKRWNLKNTSISFLHANTIWNSTQKAKTKKQKKLHHVWNTHNLLWSGLSLRRLKALFVKHLHFQSSLVNHVPPNIQTVSLLLSKILTECRFFLLSFTRQIFLFFLISQIALIKEKIIKREGVDKGPDIDPIQILRRKIKLNNIWK
jgi:hypothetical protein